MSTFTPEEILEIIEEEYFNIECINVPTGGDDYDVIWEVYSHHQAKPNKRLEGQGSTIAEAIEDALSEGDIRDNDLEVPDINGYTRADEDWFFDMDGKG